MLLILGVFVALGLWFWMLIRTSRSSMLLAILSFFFWPLLIVALVKNWNDEESDIKVPFFIYIALMVLLAIYAAKVGKSTEEQEALNAIIPPHGNYAALLPDPAERRVRDVGDSAGGRTEGTSPEAG